jgi:hypothetical protein
VPEASTDPGAAVVELWAALAAHGSADPRLCIRECGHAFTYLSAELAGRAAQRAADRSRHRPAYCSPSPRSRSSWS